MTDTAEIARALRSGLNWDLPALVRTTPLPVQVVAAGTAEGPTFLEGGSALGGADRDALRHLVPEDHFIVVEGGHSPHHEHPERMAELISSFAGALVVQE